MVQLSMPLKMCNYQGQKGCLKSYWYSFSLPLRWKYLQKYIQPFGGQNHYFQSKMFISRCKFNNRCLIIYYDIINTLWKEFIFRLLQSSSYSKMVRKLYITNLIMKLIFCNIQQTMIIIEQ